MPNAELVFAGVYDRRIFENDGEAGQPLVYTVSLPGRALPFVVTRHWKAPQGYVSEFFELIAPSGKTAYSREPYARKMPGQMDLAEITDVVTDAVFDEIGIYVASFGIDGAVEGQVEFQLVIQSAPDRLPKDVEDALKKSDVIWVGVERDGRDLAVPVWFAYRQGRVYLLHTNDRSTGEQEIPGLPDANDLLVVTRRKGRDTRADRFHASARIIEPGAPEFDELAGILADRRRDRHGPPQDAIAKWRSSCVIAELTPIDVYG